MTTTYIVKKGDTLSKIAENYKDVIRDENGNLISTNSARTKYLAKINDIPDPTRIVVGQTIIISGSAVTPAKTTTSRATIKAFGLQSNTDRTMYATWSWTKSYTENYQTIWYYDTGNGVWFIGNDSTTTDKQSVYTAPSNAIRVKFKVKPISKKHKVNDKETSYWTANWSTEKKYDFSNNPPTTPPVPDDPKIENFTLTVELDNLDVNATDIYFQIVKDNTTIFRNGKASIVKNHASYKCTISAGAEYKVRCRSYRDKKYSEWSEYSKSVSAMPSVPSIKTCKAKSETSVYLEWSAVKTAKTYDIEYATKKEYFDSSNATQTTTGIEFTHYELTGLESGENYFFRVRAVNSDSVHSGWSSIKSVVIGKEPAAPTTWSSTTTATVGEDVILYWMHNSRDESSQTRAKLYTETVGGAAQIRIIENTAEEDEKDKVSSFVLSTSGYTEGAKIEWKVCTAGVTGVYGDWSVLRTIDIYAPPVLELNVTNSDGDALDTLESFPFRIKGLAGPSTQAPIGYHLNITANESYETVDNVGNFKMVNAGESVYSKYVDTSEALMLEMSANNVDLENNISYTVTCVVSMNSGLTAEASSEFIVSWTDMEYEPNAEISIDEETLTASIRPYCENENGILIEGVLLSVYRRDYDGNFTEIGTDIDNTKATFITDPHPALDYARYRIVAKTVSTGAISYCDMAGYPVGGNAVIIQWEEDWTSFDVYNEDALEEASWSGSMLKLPYNIDVSDNHQSDVSLIEYIGREHPVSYYGTQRGVTSTWNVEIVKEDVETLYALRRLAKWMGDVYVREPSGSGYWANVSVSFSQKHCELTIPVTLNITRVSGGV